MVPVSIRLRTDLSAREAPGDVARRDLFPEPGDRAARDKPLDFFLESLADSLGERALVVVLTGMGKYSAVGVRAVKQTGGTVIAQSEDTAE